MQNLYHFIICLSFFTSSLFLSDSLAAQSFEGEIMFAKETAIDTTFFTYKIKGNKIRLEALNEQKELINYMLVDVENSIVHTVNPKRKLYVEMPGHSKLGKVTEADFEIFKTQNYKSIKGYKCFQWRVRNKKEDTEIAYWVSDEIFGNFAELLKLVNRNEKNTLYYLRIPETSGFFPLLVVNRSTLREWRMHYKLIEIKKKTIPASVFNIPSGYRKFE